MVSYDNMIFLYGGIHDITHEINDLLVLKNGTTFCIIDKDDSLDDEDEE